MAFKTSYWFEISFEQPFLKFFFAITSRRLLCKFLVLAYLLGNTYVHIFFSFFRYFLTLSSSILCAIQIPNSVKKSLHLLLRKQRKVTLSNSLLFGNKTKLKILNGNYFVKFMYSEKTTKFDEISIIVLTLKFIHSEKATKFCETSTLLATLCTVVKSKVEISQNFVAFSEYMNFTKQCQN